MSKISYATSKVKIKVVGCGGGGCNAITRMVRSQIHGVEFIALNTDAQHLAITEATTRIQIGEGLTHGMGAGGDHLVGRRSAEETRDEIKQALPGLIWSLLLPAWVEAAVPVQPPSSLKLPSTAVLLPSAWSLRPLVLKAPAA